MPKTNLQSKDIQHYFENWIIESGLGLRHNVATYYIEETVVRSNKFSFRQRFEDRIVLHILTNKPSLLKGKDGDLLRKYRKIFTSYEHVMDSRVDDVIITEVKSQENIHKGIVKKIKGESIHDFSRKNDSGRRKRNMKSQKSTDFFNKY